MLIICRQTILGMIVASMAGCASLGISQSAEERVEKRAQERLDAVMSEDFEKAHTFVSPARRESVSPRDHAARYGGIRNWTEATVQSVTCDVDRCDVRVRVRYLMQRLKVENTRYLDEVWIEVGGKWYFYYN